MRRHLNWRSSQGGFTLLELLVVMAITAILLGLIFGPLVQGFNLTNRARVQVETQDTARRASEIGQRDLAQAVFVFDNSSQPINFWVRQPDANGDPKGPAIAQPMPFAYLDMVAPARYRDQDPNPAASDIDPTTGLVIDRGDIALPVAPGRVIIRYFLGLRNNTSVNNQPSLPYGNFYDNPRVTTLQEHNPFILYRAVISPYTTGGAADTRLFKTDANGNPVLYDPNFFYDTTVAVKPNDPAITTGALTGWKDDNKDGKVNICENWKVVARSIVPTDRADEAVVERDDNKKPIYFPDPVNGPYTKINPLVKFQPSYMGNDAGTPTSSGDPANEMPITPPPTHRETYGHWTNPYNLYVYRGSLAGPVLNFFYWDGSNNPVSARTYNTTNGASAQTSAKFFPNRFSLQAGKVDTANPPLVRTDPPQIMFSVDARRGVVNFAFPDWIFLYDDSTGLPKPSIWTPTDLAGVNTAYNTAFAADPNNAHRQISLKKLPDGRLSPVKEIPNCIVVPGSEVVKGPDMRPGPHYGKEIIYTRLPRTANSTDIGLNEYMINYVDEPNPPAGPVDPMTADYLSAGTIIFSSEQSSGGVNRDMPTVDADGNPAAPLVVTYQIQNNLLADSVKADYLTRQLMSFALGVRLYEFNSGQPQQVTLTQKVTVRNLQR